MGACLSMCFIAEITQCILVERDIKDLYGRLSNDFNFIPYLFNIISTLHEAEIELPQHFSHFSYERLSVQNLCT
jgi:hypothetical protein